MYFPVSALLIEYMILSVVESRDSYGYEISQTVKKAADIKESTLYPILKKLQIAGYLTTYSQEYQGRKRKYYSLTEETGKGGLRDDVFRRVPGQKTEVLFDHRSRKNTDGVPAGRMEVLS